LRKFVLRDLLVVVNLNWLLIILKWMKILFLKIDWWAKSLSGTWRLIDQGKKGPEILYRGKSSIKGLLRRSVT